TGQVFNGTSDFVVSSGSASGPALFLFATEAGQIAGWAPAVPPPAPSTAAQVAATVDGAVFKGLAIGRSGGANFLYAADFANGRIVVFDGTFQQTTLAGTFTDPDLPEGYSPFNVQAVGDKLYVTYAKQDEDDPGEEVAGDGLGVVDVFNTDGTFDRRLASEGGVLNA